MVFQSPKTEYFSINGIDVTIYKYDGILTKTKQPVKNATYRFNINIKNVLSVDDTLIGKTFIYKRGFTTADIYKLRGEIVNYRITGNLLQLEISDKLYAAVRLERDYTYDMNIDTSAGVGSEIVKDLFTYCGINYTDASVPTTGTDNSLLIKVFPASGSVLSTLKQLATLYNRQLYYSDVDDLGYFIPESYISANTTLTIGTNVVNRIQWLTAGEDLINQLTITGGQQLDWNNEPFTATASQTIFTVKAKPVDTEVYVNGTLKNRGVNSSDPKDFYVRDDLRQLIFTNPMTGGETVEINYSYNVPAKATIKNDTSIDTYKEHDLSISSLNITNSEDAELRATAGLASNDTPLTSAPLRVIGNNDLDVGQVAEVIDNINNMDGFFLITQVTFYSPTKPDEIVIGKRPLTTTDITLSIVDNLTKLARQISTNSDVNVQILPTTENAEVYSYEKIEHAISSATTAYYDVDTYDGTKVYSDGSAETYSVISLIPSNQTILEDFYNTEFKYSSTATWTGSGTCTFTTSQNATGGYYLLQNDSIIAATLTADNNTNLTFQISTDNSHWENCTSGTEHTFTNPGNQLYWKATASGTATLRTIKITYR